MIRSLIPVFLTALMISFLMLSPGFGENGASKISLFQLNRSLKTWSIDDGLPGGSCDAMAQTPDGYLWLGSAAGLTQFNGTSFRNFNTTNHPDIAHDDFPFLTVDRSGALWALNPNKQLLLVRNSTIKKIDWPARPVNGFIEAIAPAADDGIVVSLRVDGLTSLYAITESSVTEISDPQKIIGKPLGIATSPDGIIWMTTRDRQLLELKGRTLLPAKLPSLNDGRTPVSESFRFLDGAIGLIGKNAIYRYSGSQWEEHLVLTTPLPNPSRLAAACQDGDGNFWINTSTSGIWIIRPNGSSHRLETSPLRIENARTFFRDRDGSIWIGYRPGLHQIRYTPFVTVTPAEINAPPRACSIAEDGEGTIWVGCSENLFHLPPGGTKLVLSKEYRSFPSVAVVGHPKKGAWIALPNARIYQRIERDKGVTLIPTTNKQTLRANFSGILAGAEDDFWIATGQGLFHTYPFKEKTERILVPFDTKFPPLSGIGSGPNGKLHVISTRHGLFRQDRDKWSCLIPKQVESPHGFDYDSKGRLWTISHRAGRLGYTLDGETHYRSVDEFPMLRRELTGIRGDDIGGLWIASSLHGVGHFDADQLQRFIDGETDQPGVTWFQKPQGLASKSCSWLRSGLIRSRDQRIWVATAEGPSVIDPAEWQERKKNQKASPIHIEQFLIDGKPALPPTPGATISKLPEPLAPESNRLVIQIASLDFDSPFFNGFRYRLLGESDKWSDTESDSSAVFQNLPPGSYTFEVQPVHLDHSTPLSSASIQFTILPAWWQRTDSRLAMVGLVIIALALCYLRLLHRFRKRQAVQTAFSRQLIDSQEQERKRIAGELHDSLGQHLLLIKNSTELVRRKLVEASPEQTRLREVTQIASDALGEVRTITGNLRPIGLDRLGLRVATRSMLKRTSEHTDIEIEHNLIGLEGDWNENATIAIYRLIQEGLNNAIKHSQATHIQVNALTSAQKLTIEINDNGIGFDTQRSTSTGNSGGLGLTGMRERSKLLGGSFQITSSPGKGTSVRISIPLQSVIS